MNFNPQQTLRNNHLFFGFGKSSRMLRHSFGSLISGRLRRCCSFLTLALYKRKNPRSADKNLPNPAKLNWNAITLQTKQCLLRNVYAAAIARQCVFTRPQPTSTTIEFPLEHFLGFAGLALQSLLLGRVSRYLSR